MQGVTVGPGPDDVIAAIWCCSSYTKGEIPEVRDTVSGIEEEQELNERLLGMFGKGKSGLSKLKVSRPATPPRFLPKTYIPQVLRAINAELFIDDHYGNLEPIVSSGQPIHCLLFGDYPWNRSRSGFNTPGEFMTYAERVKAGVEITVHDIEVGMHLHRVRDWPEVIEWVKKWDEEAAGRELDAE
jgi:hypothetical protein